MNNWQETTLEDVAEKIAMGPFGSNIKVDTFVNNGVPIISGQHLRGYRLDDKTGFNFISEEHAVKLKNSMVYRGDVIFTHAGNIGQVAFIPDNSKYERYIISQRQFFLRCNKEKLDAQFITYFFKSRYGQYILLANANQVGVPSIAQPSSYLKSLKINLPSIDEQKSIAAVLSSLDDKIELLRKQNETLEKMAQAIFKRWFVEFEYADDNGKPYKSSGGKMVESELGVIPEGWRVGKIFELGKIICGKTPSKTESDNFGGIIHFIKIPDMHNQTFVIDTEDSLTDKGANSQKTKYLPANSICVSCIATVGLVSITTKKAQTNQQINTIIPNKEYLFEYIYLVMQRMNNNLQLIGLSGTTTSNINTGTFMNLSILLPSDEMLKQFHKIADSFFQKIKNNTFQIKALSNLRDTLLPKLMSGEVRV